MARIAADRIGSAARRREEHVWYELDLAGDRPQRTLAPPLELRRARTAADTALFAALQDGPAEIPPESELWLVVEDDRPAFSCEIYRRRTPMIAARGGWLAVPPGAVVLENSYTSSDFRGRGVAPGAWCAIADGLAVEGLRRMLTKVEVENAPSRRAVEKAGFVAIALMRLSQLGPRRVVSVHPPPGGVAAWLDNELDHGADPASALRRVYAAPPVDDSHAVDHGPRPSTSVRSAEAPSAAGTDATSGSGGIA